MSSSLSIESVTAKALQSQYVAWARAGKTTGGAKGREARVVADYIRHALRRLAADEGTSGAVHIQRLLSAVRSQLAWLIPPVDEPPWAQHDYAPDQDSAEETQSIK